MIDAKTRQAFEEFKSVINDLPENEYTGTDETEHHDVDVEFNGWLMTLTVDYYSGCDYSKYYETTTVTHFEVTNEDGEEFQLINELKKLLP